MTPLRRRSDQKMTTSMCPTCGAVLGARAVACPKCGHRSEAQEYRELLSSLATISSILVGFGLAGLVEILVSLPESRSTLLNASIGLWLVSSLILLAVLVGAEMLRMRRVGPCEMQASLQSLENFHQLCSLLFYIFAAAVALMAIGIIMLGFSFSLGHGVAGVVAAVFALVVIASILLRSSPKT